MYSVQNIIKSWLCSAQIDPDISERLRYEMLLKNSKFGA
jgi:hypothetical protein